MLRPLRDRIVVKPLDRKISEILIIQNAEKFNLGEIVAVGPKAKDVSVGDRIRFGESNKTTAIDFPRYHENGIEYLVLQEADVCFVENA